ncbi:MAG: adhesin [Prevotella fusca]|uniref:adhesin n=1 Tax=Prevotella fusca TaxID=589436 RepID=UPI003FA05032
MARHFTLITIALFILGLFSHTGAMAQGQDSKHIWNGNSIDDVADKSDEDMNTIYLYNVGTKKFLNTGSYWGTVAIGFNVGMPIHIKNYGSGKYKMEGPLGTSAGNLIAFGRRRDTPGPENHINYNHVYVDRGIEFDHSKVPNNYGSGKHPNGIIDWTFTETYHGSKTYCISFYNEEDQGYKGTHCLRMDRREYSNENSITFPKGINKNERNCLWRIVTKKDLKKAFKEKYASDEAPSDATFLIYDQNFSRSSNYVTKWVNSGVQWKYYSETEKGFVPDDNKYTYYVGNGSVKPNYYMANFAGYTNANVRNVGNSAKANGSVTQSVKTIKKGWYKVSCNGFYNRSGNSNMVSSFFAKVQSTNASISNVSTKLNKFRCEFSYTKAELLRIYTDDDLEKSKGGKGNVTYESPYVKAGKLFERGKYTNSILVYVPHDGDILDIGVEIKGSTNERDWTCWDNVQLQYCGNNDIVLDEREKSIDYIQQQVDALNAGTLILKRTMKVNTWNSIMLPVNLTVGQVKTAFGEDAKLSCRPKQHSTVKSRIEFKSVNLDRDDEEIAIEANHLYLIKPQKEPTGIEREDPYKKQLKNNRWLEIPAPYYVINNVSLIQDPSELTNYSEGVIKESSTTSTTKDEMLRFCGSVINQTDKVVPANSYALGSNDGKWYFTQHPLQIKGFRCWIATGSQAYAKTIRFFIDGVEEDMVTGIDNIVVENSNNNEVMGTVYNLNGQVVRAGATSLEGLPKGIYIVNNKKYIVK